MDSGTLTNAQIARLARSIAAPVVESVALEYLNIDEETIGNLKFQHRGNAEAFSRDILRNWRHQNGGINQVQVWLLFVSYSL